VSAAVLAAIAILLPRFQVVVSILTAQPPQLVEEKVFHKGRNNTILLLSNADSGLGNVVLATASALLAEQPQLEIHCGTFKKFHNPIEKINQLNASPSRDSIVHAHIFKSKGFGEIAEDYYKVLDNLMHKPGLAGFEKFLRLVTHILQPLNLNEYLDNYHEIVDLIEKVDPSVIAIEPMFSPAIDAAITTNRRYVLVSPNALRDAFAVKQPWGAALWKYPA